MAKGAAKQEALGGLHKVLTIVFQRTLDTYLQKIEKEQELLCSDDISDELLAAIMDKGFEPNPAMLGAISKFLKDNEIAFDDEDVDKLSKTEIALKARREARSNVTQLRLLPAVGEE
jgi:hypothetical protein